VTVYIVDDADVPKDGRPVTDARATLRAARVSSPGQGRHARA